tara:strand:+ start:310 stop:549 length:240 start_codon:yes stop_codon:yes gene_type:complete
MEDHLLFRDILEVVDQLRIVIEDLVVVVLLKLVSGVVLLMEPDHMVEMEFLYLDSLIQYVFLDRLLLVSQPLQIPLLDI